jgi:5'-methylthioadenosine phosphorylase
MTEQICIGVIGGSGLYRMAEITDKVTHVIPTPFGNPSSDVVVGTLRGKRVAFLPRHGIGHVYLPSDVPYRANIYALKMLGVKYIIAVNACGSLREDYAPGHVIIPDQLFDYTNGRRERTFFGNGLVGHISVAEPFCPQLSDQLYQAVQQAGGVVHKSGRLLVEEGPRFATRGESHVFRQWGCDLIGMTTAPEAFLAREAEIAYAAMAHVTDYDSWHVSEEPVTVDMVIATFHQNIELAQQAVAAAVENLDETTTCSCHDSLANAIMTDRGVVPQATLDRLKPIVGRYFNQQ